MERMGIQSHLTNVVKTIYKIPDFKTEMEGISSAWLKQETGLRQGCPLSPYHFLIVLTVIFHDISKKEETKKTFIDSRILGNSLNEVL